MSQNNSQNLLSSPESNNLESLTVEQKLRQENRQLISKIIHLEQDIKDYTALLATETEARQNADIMINQQVEEINYLQQQLANLLSDIELAHQTNQKQQMINQNLSEKLESNLQQVASLERECVYLQENYQNQCQENLVQKKQIQELQARLYRQQHYNLELKAALTPYLEQTNQAKTFSDFPKAKPIKSWTNHQDLGISNGNSGEMPSKIVNLPQESVDLPKIEVQNKTPKIVNQKSLTVSSIEQDNSPISKSPLPPAISSSSPNINQPNSQPKNVIDLPNFIRSYRQEY